MSPSELRLGFAVVAGAATFFAPCAYPMLPGYVAYFLGDSRAESRTAAVVRAILVALIASGGVITVYLGLVGVVTAVGAEWLASLPLFGLAVGGLLIALGLATYAGVEVGTSVMPRLPERRRSLGGYFAFGVGYAVAAAGCTAPLFVGVALTGLGRGPGAALATVAAYAAGMSALLIGTTVLAALGRASLIARVAPRGDRLERAAGVLLVAAGVAQVYLYMFRFGGLELLGGA